jgi:hypothetical protein
MNTDYAYYMLDSFLRNNLDDDNYAEFSEALEAICQGNNIALLKQCLDAFETDDWGKKLDASVAINKLLGE